MRTVRSAVGFLLAAFAAHAFAQTAPPDLSLQLVTSEVPAPIGVRAPHDGSGRLFVFSQAGTIRVIDKNGQLLPTPFLTLSVTFPGTGGTSGLLGLAFHPNYGHPDTPHNDELYVVYMRSGNCSAAGSCLGSGPDEVLERYTVSANPNVANPTGTVVMRLADNSPPSFHNGGDIHFGPDGYLYMSSGDGGQESGTHWLAECLWKKPNDTTSASCDNSSATPQYFLRGKMLRIDVDNRGAIASEEMCGTATGAPAEYSIPADNPFVGSTHTCDETYLWGFRNPWRWSFDRETGDMWIGDVGQNHWEEINLRTADSTDPIYYGWHCMEGTSVFNSSQVCTPPLAANVLPLIEYDHANSRCAVTGGYRYRGPIKPLRGMYIFADSCSSEIFFAKPDDGGGWSFTTWLKGGPAGYGTFSGFGEDEAGNLYAANTNGGEHKVFVFHSDGGPAVHTVTPTAGPGGSIAPDTPQTVDDGDTTAFTVTPDSHHDIAEVTGCGGNLAGNVYTTGAITADCTVSATFAAITHTVTPVAGAGGSIDPGTPQTVDDGDTIAFTLAADTGYVIDTATGCGGTLEGDVFTTAPITADCEVDATFGVDPGDVVFANGFETP
ncbi:MAG TPA: PQQ-dependent sugar dehydrogenase [Rhodanobacteraceae bacterium]|nr:PQQ-dependent sugar dehydrogenase [Rhodanobacteraceae bacterium]